MYTKLYPEMMQTAQAVHSIVRAVWDLVGAGKLAGVGDDGVRSYRHVFYPPRKS